jgi:hypothetical protein
LRFKLSILYTMPLRFIAIRLLQLFRAFVGIGFIRLVVLVALSVFLAVQLHTHTSVWPNAMFIAIGALLIIGTIHIKRPDTQFLKTSFPNYKSIVLTEYLVFSLPIMVMMLAHQQWLALATLALGILLVSRFGVSKKPTLLTINKRIVDLLPPMAFEWKAGLRQSWLLLIPLWVVGFVSINFIGSAPLAILVVGLITFTFYEEGEPYNKLTVFEISPARFVRQKAFMNMAIFAVLMAPHTIAFMAIHRQYWYIAPAALIVLTTIHGYLTLTKYSFYQPNVKLMAAQSFYTIGFVAIFAPIILPVVWLLAIRFYFLSIKNLKPYLHDFH